MAILKDSFGNEINELDRLGSEAIIDTRISVQNITAINGEVVMDCASTNSASLDVKGTFVGTLAVEGTINGNDYFTIPFFAIASETFQSSVTSTGSWIINLPSGLKRLRVRATAFSSGVALVALRGSSGDNILYSKPIPTTISVTSTAPAGSSVGATLPAVVGLNHYITRIRISKYVAANLTPAANPIIVTTTNIQGTPSFDFKTLGSLGDSEVVDLDFTSNPLKSSVTGTTTTIVCPVATGVIWKVQAYWYVGN